MECEIYNEDKHLDLVLKMDVRDEDVMELLDEGVGTLEEAVLNELQAPGNKWVILHEGRCLTVFGVCETAEGVGSPWMWGTNEMTQWPVMLCKESKHFLERCLDEWPTLFTLIHSENHIHIKWCKQMGFTVVENRWVSDTGAIYHGIALSRRYS